ncbi:hypothetical protein T265_09094 [Opisthorchis viverrini]|uniref:Uncharacterized protein n=1 Tax=Opisthorchis viverrini TaxID=6198 RepID=A0A074Z750_OPIVI|nr:hypothetical protein T265_09094 [Opisthorchis viverrini]KER22923.1 hypothetical protein T265_09094 [Opisthorchis viverrini]
MLNTLLTDAYRLLETRIQDTGTVVGLTPTRSLLASSGDAETAVTGPVGDKDEDPVATTF